MDTTKLGIATARAMEEIDRFAESGDISEDAYIGAVVICVAIDEKVSEEEQDNRHIRGITTSHYVFSEPEEVYIQTGLLTMALDNIEDTSSDSDEE